VTRVDYSLFAAVSILLYQIVFWTARLRDLVQCMVRVPVIGTENRPDAGEDLPMISVVVPAHNEQAGIAECLQSVLEQDYPRFEVILVNDRSEDLTATIAKKLGRGRSNFRMIDVRELPSGWTGKCHALDVGVRYASGDWLAFLDADSALHPSALRQCYRTAVEHAVNMITLSPKFVLKTFWEKALQPVFVAMSCILFPLSKINDPASPVASANGMFYLISRTAYEKIGGHHDVKGLAVEDIGIGKRVKASGLGLLFANGRHVLRTRMYTGFGEVLNGWIRILSASMNYELGKVLKYLTMHTLMSPLASIFAFAVFIPAAQSFSPALWISLLLAFGLAATVVQSWFCAQLGISPRYSGLIFLGNLFLIWVFLVIIKKILMKDALQWRGTTYQSTLYEPTALNPEEAPRGYTGSAAQFLEKTN